MSNPFRTAEDTADRCLDRIERRGEALMDNVLPPLPVGMRERCERCRAPFTLETPQAEFPGNDYLPDRPRLLLPLCVPCDAAMRAVVEASLPAWLGGPGPAPALPPPAPRSWWRRALVRVGLA